MPIGGPTPILEFSSKSGLISVERVHNKDIDVSTFLDYFMTGVYRILEIEIARGDRAYKNMKKLNEMFKGLTLK